MVVEKLKGWLAERGPEKADQPIFQLRTPKGHFRKTSKMMKADLAQAREEWIKEAKGDEEGEKREASDFLTYQNASGDFADFHANRHTFISRLGRQGVPLGIAQKLARHSDPRLTSNRYTHLELTEKAAAITGLKLHESVVSRDGQESVVTGMVTGTPAADCRDLAKADAQERQTATGRDEPNPLNDKTLGNNCHQESVVVRIHPSGFEPETSGSVGLGARLENAENVRFQRDWLSTVYKECRELLGVSCIVSCIL